MSKALWTAAIVVLATIAWQAEAKTKTLDTSVGKIAVVELAKGLDHPWGMAFLPDGRLLVTEREGRLRILNKDNTLTAPLAGVPKVVAEGQGGLLDVAIDPDFKTSKLVYLSYAEAGAKGSHTSLGRGRLDGNALKDFKVLFRQTPSLEEDKHYGGRIAFGPDGHVFLTMGDRFQFDPAQNLTDHLGTIVRINPDGSVPKDNPFVKRLGARPEIWSYGHRNIQAAAFNGHNLWVAEMGPKGGDELNRVEKGGNYGWPLVSWGTHYDGEDIPDPSSRPDFKDAAKQWTPVIAPSGMIFYTGSVFPQWKGSAFIGGLMAKGLVRVPFNDNAPGVEERLILNERIRDVEQAPDGALYVLTDDDNGRIWRLAR